MPKTVKRRKNKLAGRYRNRWPDEAEISGRMIPKWVADSCRNRWPDHPEIRKFKDQSKARFDSRHKTEVYTEFREQLLKQKANAPKDNLNAPNQRIKNPNTPNRNTPKY